MTKATRRRIKSLLIKGGNRMGELDYLGAAARYLEAVKLGSAEGAFWLGSFYEFGGLSDIPLDYTQAARFFSQAAEQGHIEAQMHLARLYEEGNGVEKNREKAGRYWLSAAQAGNSYAQWSYAMFLFFDADDEERKKNVEEAKCWLKASEDKGGENISPAMRSIEQWERDGYLQESKNWIESDDPTMDPFS